MQQSPSTDAISSGKCICKFPFADLPTGIYFFTLTDDGAEITGNRQRVTFDETSFKLYFSIITKNIYHG